MFTQVGVIVLIASYMVGGAFVFQHIEQDSLMEQALTAQDVSSKIRPLPPPLHESITIKRVKA